MLHDPKTVIGSDFDQETAEKIAPQFIPRLELANCMYQGPWPRRPDGSVTAHQEKLFRVDRWTEGHRRLYNRSSRGPKNEHRPSLPPSYDPDKIWTNFSFKVWIKLQVLSFDRHQYPKCKKFVFSNVSHILAQNGHFRLFLGLPRAVFGGIQMSQH